MQPSGKDRHGEAKGTPSSLASDMLFTRILRACSLDRHRKACLWNCRDGMRILLHQPPICRSLHAAQPSLDVRRARKSKIGCGFKLPSLCRLHPVSASCHEWVSRAWCELDGGERVEGGGGWWWLGRLSSGICGRLVVGAPLLPCVCHALAELTWLVPFVRISTLVIIGNYLRVCIAVVSPSTQLHPLVTVSS